jgi:two-component system, chemotaxis family, chemotaxis protein CheY
MLSVPSRHVCQRNPKANRTPQLVVADQSQHTRKLTRMMLMNIGARSIYEAADGLAALDIIRDGQPRRRDPGLGNAVDEWPRPHTNRSIAGRIYEPNLPVILLTTGPIACA